MHLSLGAFFFKESSRAIYNYGVGGAYTAFYEKPNNTIRAGARANSFFDRRLAICDVI